MEFARIPGISVPVSRIVMGTDWLGARSFAYLAGRRFMSPLVDRRRERDNFALLDGVVEAGCTAFDTARAYPDSERSLGAWLRGRGLRQRIVIISKGGHPGPRWEARLTSADVTSDLEQSLKTLATDYIDLYLLHYDDPAAPIEPLVETLNRHIAAGKVRAIGVSNWPARRIAAAADYAARAGRTPFVASSVQFSLASWQKTPWPSAHSISGDDADAERRWYRDQRLCVLAYSSLAMGFFSPSRPYAGGRSATPAKADRFGDQVFVNDRNLARLARATDLAARRGVSPGQIALAWVLRYDPRVLALVGARTVASFVDAVQAFGVPLSESEREWLSHGP